MQRLYPLQHGRILIDGHDIARVTQQSLRDAIAVVPQDISMLNRIAAWKTSAMDGQTPATMKCCARRSRRDAGPSSKRCLKGSRPWLATAASSFRAASGSALPSRARFVKDAPILIFDEATAALDSESEEAIREAIDSLMRGRTVITIAHRLSTLRNFDRILVMQAGRLVEDGAPEELMRTDGHYRRLVNRELSRLAKQAA